MAISSQKLENIIREHFPNAIIKITDLAGDQDHYSLEITDSKFQGLNILTQHRMVKAALSNILDKELHALTIKTKIPD